MLKPAESVSINNLNLSYYMYIIILKNQTLIFLSYPNSSEIKLNHLSHDMTKPTKWVCAQWRLRSAWASAQSDQELSTWRKLGSLATHWAHSDDSDQTGWMPRLIWVFVGHTLNLFLSCRESFQKNSDVKNLSENPHLLKYCIKSESWLFPPTESWVHLNQLWII